MLHLNLNSNVSRVSTRRVDSNMARRNRPRLAITAARYARRASAYNFKLQPFSESMFKLLVSVSAEVAEESPPSGFNFLAPTFLSYDHDLTPKLFNLHLFRCSSFRLACHGCRPALLSSFNSCSVFLSSSFLLASHPYAKSQRTRSLARQSRASSEERHV